MFYWFLKATLGVFLRVVFRPIVTGIEHVPKTGPAIIASNHLSFSDSLFIPLVVHGRKVTYPAKLEYFNRRGFRGTVSRWFFTGIGMVPMDRSGGRASEAGLRECLDILERGQILGIYPEGTRSMDGRLYRGRTGVAWLALRAGVPVIPCAMVGTDRLQPPGKLVPKVVRPQIKFGPPLEFSRYAGMENDRFAVRALTDELMYQIMTLSGQEYVDVYSTKAKAERLREARNRSAREPAGSGRTTPTDGAGTHADDVVPEASGGTGDGGASATGTHG